MRWENSTCQPCVITAEIRWDTLGQAFNPGLGPRKWPIGSGDDGPLLQSAEGGLQRGSTRTWAGGDTRVPHAARPT